MCCESEWKCVKILIVWWWFFFRYGDWILKFIFVWLFVFLWIWIGIVIIVVVISSIIVFLMSMVFWLEKMLYGIKVRVLDKLNVIFLNFKFWKSVLWIEILVMWKKNNIIIVMWNIMIYVIRYLEFN